MAPKISLFVTGWPGGAAWRPPGFNHWKNPTKCNKESSAHQVPHPRAITIHNPVPRTDRKTSPKQPKAQPPTLDDAQIRMFVFSNDDPIINRFKRSAKGGRGSRQRSKGAQDGVKEARREARRRERQSRRFEVNFFIHSDKTIWNRQSKLGGAVVGRGAMLLSWGLPAAVGELKVRGLPRSLEAAGGRRGWRLAGVGGCRCS